MGVITNSRSYPANGRSYDGFLANGSDGEKAPGVLVVHEGRGYTQHPKDRALMLAELGYVAYAPDYFGGAGRSLEHSFEYIRPFERDRSLFHLHGLAALDVLRSHPGVDVEKLAAIGFCWGGYAVLELACATNLRCGRRLPSRPVARPAERACRHFGQRSHIGGRRGSLCSDAGQDLPSRRAIAKAGFKRGPGPVCADPTRVGQVDDHAKYPLVADFEIELTEGTDYELRAALAVDRLDLILTIRRIGEEGPKVVPIHRFGS